MRECLNLALSLCLCVRTEAAANAIFLTIVIVAECLVSITLRKKMV